MIALKLLPFPIGRPALRDIGLKTFVPLVGFITLVVAWQLYVTHADVPRYILPSPVAVVNSIMTDWPVLGPALWVTTKTTVCSLILAVVGGVGLAIIIAQSRWIERLFYPLTVILQVTPIVAIAPLILIYAPSTFAAQLICAWLVAFFPILSNTLQGLKSADRYHSDLLRTYAASRWQRLRYLQVPSAMPYVMAGLRISGGLSLVATVVGEFAAGAAGSNAGLAFRLLEAQSRLNTPRLFAALVLLAVLGAAIFYAVDFLSRRTLRRWHESQASVR